MEGYLLDTCTVCAYWEPAHPFYAVTREEIDVLEGSAPRFVSRITLAEIEFGILLDEAATGIRSARAVAILEKAQEYRIREISRHTAHEYAELRKNIATTYLSITSNRPRWIDLWMDRSTGEQLQIDENDVWICAQARELNLIVVTTDRKMVRRISKADPQMQFKLLTA